MKWEFIVGLPGGRFQVHRNKFGIPFDRAELTQLHAEIVDALWNAPWETPSVSEDTGRSDGPAPLDPVSSHITDAPEFEIAKVWWRRWRATPPERRGDYASDKYLAQLLVEQRTPRPQATDHLPSEAETTPEDRQRIIQKLSALDQMIEDHTREVEIWKTRALKAEALVDERDAQRASEARFEKGDRVLTRRLTAGTVYGTIVGEHGGWPMIRWEHGEEDSCVAPWMLEHAPLEPRPNEAPPGEVWCTCESPSVIGTGYRCLNCCNLIRRADDPLTLLKRLQKAAEESTFAKHFGPQLEVVISMLQRADNPSANIEQLLKEVLALATDGVKIELSSDCFEVTPYYWDPEGERDTHQHFRGDDLPCVLRRAIDALPKPERDVNDDHNDAEIERMKRSETAMPEGEKR